MDLLLCFLGFLKKKKKKKSSGFTTGCYLGLFTLPPHGSGGFSWVAVMPAVRVMHGYYQTNKLRNVLRVVKCFLSYSLIDSYSLPCKHKANTALHHSLLYVLGSSLYSTAHRKRRFYLYGQLLFSPQFVKTQFTLLQLLPCFYLPLFPFPLRFSEWLALQGVTLASSVIISLSENSSVVWRVNWPRVQGHSAGIWMLAHCRTSVYEKTNERVEGPRRSQGRWGHPCLISKWNRGQQLREQWSIRSHLTTHQCVWCTWGQAYAHAGQYVLWWSVNFLRSDERV